MILPDANKELENELPLVAEIIARTARWVHPKTFRELPVWYPWMARSRPLYDSRWQRRYTNTKRDTGATSEKFETNNYAIKALRAALEITGKPNGWSVCHIWGYDDETFQTQSSIVRNPRYYSCIGNMVLLPTPLKGFTDALPEVKEMLKACAYYLYDWVCQDESVKEGAEAIRNGVVPRAYPKSWPYRDRPEQMPPGTAPYTANIGAKIQKRKDEIRMMLADTSLTNFPREEVRQVLEFWNMEI